MEPIAAKQFLISKVIEEAGFENVILTEVERKMLHFTEVHPSLPDIYDVNREFERDYDSDEYERKITSLLRKSRARDLGRSSGQGQQWKDAVDALREEDHYILVMVYMAFPEFRSSLLPTHRVRDYLIYIAIGVGLVLVVIGLAEWRH